MGTDGDWTALGLADPAYASADRQLAAMERLFPVPSPPFPLRAPRKRRNVALAV